MISTKNLDKILTHPGFSGGNYEGKTKEPLIYKGSEESARQDLNLRPLRPEGLGENGRAWHTVQTVIIRTFIAFLIDYSIGYSYFKTKS